MQQGPLDASRGALSDLSDEQPVSKLVSSGKQICRSNWSDPKGLGGSRVWTSNSFAIPRHNRLRWNSERNPTFRSYISQSISYSMLRLFAQYTNSSVLTFGGWFDSTINNMIQSLTVRWLNLCKFKLKCILGKIRNGQDNERNFKYRSVTPRQQKENWLSGTFLNSLSTYRTVFWFYFYRHLSFRMHSQIVRTGCERHLPNCQSWFRSAVR